MKILGQIGDVNAVDHGGGYVIDRGQGPQLVYFEGLEVWEQVLGKDLDEDEDADAVVQVYMVDLEDSAERFASWFDWIDKDAIQACCDITPHEWDEATQTPDGRADLVWSIACYCGWGELDPHPMEMTIGELVSLFDHYAELGRV